MIDKVKVIKEIILKNPNLSGNKIYEKTKAKGVGIRKTDFFKLLRKERKLPEPTKIKKEQSIPSKYKIKPTAKPKAKVKVKAKPKVRVKPKIPFEQTKFGKITRDLQKKHGISEKNAIKHARKILKIDKSDYDKINEIDVQILLTHTP